MPQTKQTGPATDTMEPGDVLYCSFQYGIAHWEHGPNRIISANGRNMLMLQDDGNVVLWVAGVWSKGLWSTNTPNRESNRFAFEHDGNLILYGKRGDDKNAIFWTADDEPWPTLGIPWHGSDRLVVQNDGNLVLCKGKTMVWDTQTVQWWMIPEMPSCPSGEELVCGGKCEACARDHADAYDEGCTISRCVVGYELTRRTSSPNVCVETCPNGKFVTFTDDGEIQCGASCPSGEYQPSVLYSHAFDGECSGHELQVYDASKDGSNPGTDLTSKLNACAQACAIKKLPLSHSWGNDVALGFVIEEDSGSCWCEFEYSYSSDCRPKNQDEGVYQRYDFAAASYSYAFDGECSGNETKIYDDDTNPGRLAHLDPTNPEDLGPLGPRLNACAQACQNATNADDVALGFVVRESGSCWCEFQYSDKLSCNKTNADEGDGYQRYDFVARSTSSPNVCVKTCADGEFEPSAADGTGQCAASCPSGEYQPSVLYSHAFDGKCDGAELQIYDDSNSDDSNNASSNPGTDLNSQLKACAQACAIKKRPLSGPWPNVDDVALGFVMKEDSGSCYCKFEYASSSNCEKGDQGYQQYDFVAESTCVKKCANGDFVPSAADGTSQCGASCPSGEYQPSVKYSYAFDGECSGTELQIYDASTLNGNPGTDLTAELNACAQACAIKKLPLYGGSWGKRARGGLGFVIEEDSGSCWCEFQYSYSSNCYPKNQDEGDGYQRYDFAAESPSSPNVCVKTCAKGEVVPSAADGTGQCAVTLNSRKSEGRIFASRDVGNANAGHKGFNPVVLAFLALPVLVLVCVGVFSAMKRKRAKDESDATNGANSQVEGQEGLLPEGDQAAAVEAITQPTAVQSELLDENQAGDDFDDL